jgi:hypothetical protein
MFWLSTRKFFRAGDSGWASYMDFIGLRQLEEVRTIDGMLNEVVSDGNVGMASLEEITVVLPFLPRSVAGESYYLLFADAGRFPAVERPDLIPLGFDLSDETWTSSLLNCGVWENELALIAQRAWRRRGEVEGVVWLSSSIIKWLGGWVCGRTNVRLQ